MSQTLAVPVERDTGRWRLALVASLIIATILGIRVAAPYALARVGWETFVPQSDDGRGLYRHLERRTRDWLPGPRTRLTIRNAAGEVIFVSPGDPRDVQYVQDPDGSLLIRAASESVRLRRDGGGLWRISSEEAPPSPLPPPVAD